MPLVSTDDCWVWDGGPVPRGADGITLGRLVIVRRGRRTAHLMRHERVHVRQWRRHGVVGFVVRYVGAYLGGRLRGFGHHGAYLRIPMEIEAEWVARRQDLASPVADDRRRVIT